MSKPPPLERLKSSRIVQALILYLGASWVVLQVVDLLADALPMPVWLVPATLALLLVGLVIVLATSWVQSLPETTAAEEAGSVPTDWQVAPKDLVDSVKAGRLPHLTWGRAILGGVLAFWFLFGLAGVYAIFTGRVLSPFPTEAGADEAASGLAVVPFAVTGQDLDVWREGMADLFTTNLDGVGGIRTIASRTVLSRWLQEVADEESPDLDKVLGIAGSTGARFALVGSAVSVGGDVRLAAEIYDLSTGDEIGTARVEGSPDDVLELVDRLSIDVATILLSESGVDIVSPARVASITTESLPALQAYLEGEAAYRRSDLPRAVEAYQAAIAEDSLFALARWRLASASSWTQGYDYWSIDAEQLEAAAAHADRLPQRDADLLDAFQAFERGDSDALRKAVALTARYPDDPDAWYVLGEVFVHSRHAVLEDRADGIEALSRAVELDPSFAPYRVHLIEYAIAEDDTVGGFSQLEEYERLAGSGALPYLRMGVELFLGNEEQRERALAAVDTAPPPVLGALLSQLDWTSSDLEAQHALLVRGAERIASLPGVQSGVLDAFITQSLVAQGRADEAIEMLSTSEIATDDRAVEAWIMNRTVRPLTDEQLQWLTNLSDCEGGNSGGSCMLAVGAAAAERGDWDTFAAVVARGREGAAGAREAENQGSVEVIERSMSALEGYADLQRGNVQDAISKLESAQGHKFGQDHWYRLWLGEAHAQAEQYDQAVRYFRSMWLNQFKAYGAYRLGQIYEEFGQTEQARASYRSFLRMWAGADPDLPQLEVAREAMGRLGG
jgi:tetratricopeptide (TPR) repeat protein